MLPLKMEAIHGRRLVSSAPGFQETGDRKQGTGNRKQETGNRKQETGNRKA